MTCGGAGPGRVSHSRGVTASPVCQHTSARCGRESFHRQRLHRNSGASLRDSSATLSSSSAHPPTSTRSLLRTTRSLARRNYPKNLLVAIGVRARCAFSKVKQSKCPQRTAGGRQSLCLSLYITLPSAAQSLPLQADERRLLRRPSPPALTLKLL